MSDEAIKYNKYEVEMLLKLSKSQEFKLERIFDVYKQRDSKHFYYNIFNTINFPDDMNTSIFDVYYTKAEEPWTLISYKHFGRIDLWWLIACINKVKNTFILPAAGTRLLIPTGETIRTIIDEIKSKV
jgi:hypothetical protein